MDICIGVKEGGKERGEFKLTKARPFMGEAVGRGCFSYFLLGGLEEISVLLLDTLPGMIGDMAWKGTLLVIARADCEL